MELQKETYKAYISGDYIVFHHRYSKETVLKFAIRPENIMTIETLDGAFRDAINNTEIAYGDNTETVIETFDEILDIIKEYNELRYGNGRKRL